MEIKNLKEIFVEVFKKERNSVVGIMGLSIATYNTSDMLIKIIYLPFVIFLGFGILKDVYDVQKEKHVPVAVVAYGTKELRRAFIENCLTQMEKMNFNEANFRTLGINRDDWCILRSGDLRDDPEEWKKVTQEFRNKIDHIKATLKGPKYLHIFLKCRTALCFGLGAVAGTWNKVIIYQEISDDLKPVIYLDDRNMENHHKPHTIKNRTERDYKFIKVNTPEKLTPTTLVALNLASHPPSPHVEEEAKKRMLSCVIIDNLYNNTLSDEDWFQPAQEVASVLLNLLKDTELEIYSSCPNALAFAVGMALGDQCNVSIYHWFSEDKNYKIVLKLNELK